MSFQSSTCRDFIRRAVSSKTSLMGQSGQIARSFGITRPQSSLTPSHVSVSTKVVQYIEVIDSRLRVYLHTVARDWACWFNLTP